MPANDPFSKIATWPASTGELPGQRDAHHVGRLSQEITEGVHTASTPPPQESPPGSLTIPFVHDGKTYDAIEIDVCVSGVAKKMMLIGTAPYTP